MREFLNTLSIVAGAIWLSFSVIALDQGEWLAGIVAFIFALLILLFGEV
jgi:fatty acid desaturase